ncbi:MAG: DUF4317 domain-containing protein [Clostridia bacterium]|jgi:cytochrome c-type biogenesis protein CcmH/NrfF|nr:DUF4317 domain-containing protein [Clostridia bacterium]MCI2000112.1 DUF4317 domain-containing protein [Clostridia bacterium]MCI2014723.1 DUF4317 domain-containing protein [Clostridia bacterium]
MNKKDILELKRRLKKNECTFTRMCGCYVDANKNIRLNFGESFLTLDDDEFYKYLEIAKKVLSGTIGNNILELKFLHNYEYAGSKQQFLLGLRDSALKNDELLNRFYELVIENYHYDKNYLILVFHDAYDVIIKTHDNMKLDESEEVYDYILCAICPVELTKPGLIYREDENRIAPRIRDWAVSMPEIGFVFPAFSDRSSDVNSVMYYTKNAKDTHPEFMESVLGCEVIRTAAEEKEKFSSIIKEAVGDNTEQGDHIFMKIQKDLNYMVEENDVINNGDSEQMALTENTINDIMSENNIPEDVKDRIVKSYGEEFGDTPPAAKNLIDSKAIKVNAQKEKTVELENQVRTLKEKLEQPPEKDIKINESNVDILLNVSAEKAEKIEFQEIDGKKYLIIPIDDGESAKINGIDKQL